MYLIQGMYTNCGYPLSDNFVYYWMLFFIPQNWNSVGKCYGMTDALV